MPERNLAIRLSVLEGGKVKAELKEIGETGEKSLKKIELAGQPASKGLLALNAAANDVKAGAVGLSSQMGPLGSGLIALGPAGLAAGAALGALTLGLTASLREAAEAEQSYNRLQAVLRATGNSSGLTAREISEFADQMEASTLITAEGVMDAASVLTTFRSVSSEAFTRTISLAQDMSSVFGKDLNASVMALGKALENPVDGLGALKKAGVDFSPVQKQMLQDMVDAGEVAKAHKIILDEVANSVAGTGTAEASGLTGATHKLAVAWKNMLEAVGETPAVAGTAQVSLETLASAFRGVAGLFKDAPFGAQLNDAKAELTEAQAVLERLQNCNPLVMTDMTPLIDSQKEKIQELRKEVEKLTVASQQEAAAIAAEKAAALKGQEDATKERNNELVATQRKKLDEALDKLVSDPSVKIAKVNAELEKTRQQMEKLRNADGSNNGAVGAAIQKAEEYARVQIENIQKPINEAARKEAEANQKVIDDLMRQRLGMTDARQAFIDQAVSRLSDKADDAMRVKTRNLAGKLFDEKSFQAAEKVMSDLGKEMDKLGDKRKAFIQGYVARLPETATQEEIDRTKELAAALYNQTEAQQKLDALKQEGKQITQGARTAEESYADQIARLTELLNAGAISQEVFNKSKDKAYDESLAGRTDPQAGAIRAFRKYQEEAEDSASAVEEAFTKAMGATEDAIVNMVTSGEVSLKSLNDLANDVVADITRMAVKQSMSGLFNWIGGTGDSGGGGGFLDDIFSAIFHEGGVVGEASAMRQVPAYVFAGAPRYHGGGIAGLKPGEVPAILQWGEEVVSRKDRQRRSSGINVVMNITTPDANSFRASQAQVSAEAARGIQRARRNL